MSTGDIEELYEKLTEECFEDISEEVSLLSELSNAIVDASKRRIEELKAGHTVGDDLESEVSEAIKHMVRYVIFHNGRHPDVPISKYEITNHVIKESNVKLRRNIPLFAIIIEYTKIRLCKVYGLHLKEITKRAVTEKGDEAILTDNQVYVVRALIPNKIRLMTRKPEDILLSGLIIYILSIIHANGGCIKKSKLNEHLADVGLGEGKNHLYLGNWEEKAIPILIKRKYIMRGKDKTGEEIWLIAENGDDQFKFDAIKKLFS